MGLRGPGSGIGGASHSAGILRRMQSGIRYLLRATFSQNVAAPLPASLPVDRGGPLEVNDPFNECLITGGVLRNTNSAGAQDKDIFLSTGFTRVCGRTLYIKYQINSTGNYPFAGWSTNNLANALSTGSGNPAMFMTTDIRIVAAADIGVAGQTIAVNDIWEFWFVLLNNGGHLFMRRNAGPITLLWTNNVYSQTVMFPHFRMQSKLVDLTDLIIYDLAPLDPRFATDYGLATSRVVSPIVGRTTATTTSAIVEMNGTIPVSGEIACHPRYMDDNNRWKVSIAQGTGILALVDVNLGAATVRGSYTTGLLAGAVVRVLTIVEVNVFKVYLNDVLRITYTDPGNFLTTSTTAQANSTSITDLTCWPRTTTLPGVP